MAEQLLYAGKKITVRPPKKPFVPRDFFQSRNGLHVFNNFVVPYSLPPMCPKESVRLASFDLRGDNSHPAVATIYPHVCDDEILQALPGSTFFGPEVFWIIARLMREKYYPRNAFVLGNRANLFYADLSSLQQGIKGRLEELPKDTSSASSLECFAQAVHVLLDVHNFVMKEPRCVIGLSIHNYHFRIGMWKLGWQPGWDGGQRIFVPA